MMAVLESPETWVYVAFVIFVVLAYRPIVRALGKALDARAGRIKSQLDEARNLREEAQKLLAEYQRKQRDALADADEIVSRATSDAERFRREAIANLEQSLARREKMALDKIAQAEMQAVADVRNQAVDIAVAAAAKVLRDSIDQKRDAALVEAAIADLERKLH